MRFRESRYSTFGALLPALFTRWRTRLARYVSAGLNDVSSALLRDTGGSADRVAVGLAAATGRVQRWAIGRGQASAGAIAVAGQRGRWAVNDNPAAQLTLATIRSFVTFAPSSRTIARRIRSRVATDGSGVAPSLANATFIALGADNLTAAHKSRSRRQEAAIPRGQEAAIVG